MTLSGVLVDVLHLSKSVQILGSQATINYLVVTGILNNVMQYEFAEAVFFAFFHIRSVVIAQPIFGSHVLCAAMPVMASVKARRCLTMLID